MKKRIFLVLCLFAFSICSSSLFAENLTVSQELQAAKYLASQWIIASVGNESDYRVEGTITRKEVSKIVAKLAWVTPEEKCEKKFSDVPADWGCKYIEWMLSAWYIVPNKTFRPDDNITKSEAVKLIFKARNIEKKYSTQNWQEDYAKTASELGLVELYTDYDTNATRGWIFRVAARGFEEYKQIEWLMSDEAL